MKFVSMDNEFGRHGFQLTFENGWTVSVVSGRGLYGGDDTAEVWSWDEDHPDRVYPNQPRGYLTMDEVAEFISEVRELE